MAGIREIQPTIDDQNTYRGNIQFRTIIDKGFKVPKKLQNEFVYDPDNAPKNSKPPIDEDWIIDENFGKMHKTTYDKEFDRYQKENKFSMNKEFKVTNNDLIEFNDWIKSRSDKNPRLMQYFKSAGEYEHFMINYQDNHQTLESDPAVMNFSKFSSKTKKFFSGVSEVAGAQQGASYKSEEEKKYSKVADLLIELEEAIFGAQGDLKKSIERVAKAHNMKFKDIKDAAIMMLNMKELDDDWGNFGDESLNKTNNPGWSPITKEGKKDLIEKVKKFSEDREKVSQEQLDAIDKEGVVQKKPNGSWGIISEQSGEWWEPDYETEEKAKNALAAYHANKWFSLRMFGNPVTEKLSDALVTKLEDIAQMTGLIDYSDIFKLKPSAELTRIVTNFYKWYQNHDANTEEDEKEIIESDHSKDFANYIKTGKKPEGKRFSIVNGDNAKLEITISNRVNEISDPDEITIPQLVGTLLFSVSYTHLFHLATSEYPAHIALQEYYESMPDLADALAEAYISVVDPESAEAIECIITPDTNDPSEYLDKVKAIVRIHQIRESIYTPYLDAIAEQLQSTIYKLKRLSCCRKVFSIR